MNSNQKVVLTLEGITNKLYSLFKDSDYEYKTYNIHSKLLPVLDEDLVILCRMDNDEVIDCTDYETARILSFRDTIVVMDKKLLDIIDTTVEFLLNYTNNIPFVKEVLNYIGELLGFEVTGRYRISLYPEPVN
jgi:hypothetical protein